MLIPVTDTPNAAKFEEIALDPTVKHYPPAHTVVVVCVIALKIVVRPVAPRNAFDVSPFASAIWLLSL